MGHALGGGPAWFGAGASAPPLTLGAGSVGLVMLWLGVLLVVVLVGGFALLFLRRWLLDTGDGRGDTGWDLRSLRAMRDQGEISDDEYERARATIVEALSKPSSPTTPAVAGPTPHSGGERRAKPGFDLTGEPLPDFSGGGENAADDDAERPEN